MHWPVAFKPGDDMFPSDGNGKLITADIDYVDVSVIETKILFVLLTLPRLIEQWKISSELARPRRLE